LAEGAGGLSVDSNLSIPYASLEKSSELAELLTLVDPKATATTKKDQLIVYLKTNLPSYNWSNLKPIKSYLKNLAL
jgi:hypothetical protein